MRDLGEFLGSPIDEESLQKLSEESVSYKRGSDDLSEYIENYNEVYESLSKNPCLLEQLEEDEPKNFPLCGVYTGDEEEESQWGIFAGSFCPCQEVVYISEIQLKFCTHKRYA